MSAFRVPPSWQLPDGVDAPLWQYTHTPRLAAEEDAYFSDHPLFQVDARILDERFVNPGPLVDLGCAYHVQVDEQGTGQLTVTDGWTSLEWHGRESLVPAGASCPQSGIWRECCSSDLSRLPPPYCWQAAC